MALIVQGVLQSFPDGVTHDSNLFVDFHIMGSNDVCARGNSKTVNNRRTYFTIVCGAAKNASNESLAGSCKENRAVQALEKLQVAYEKQIVCDVFSEPDSGIHDDLAAIDSMPGGKLNAFLQERYDFGKQGNIGG